MHGKVDDTDLLTAVGAGSEDALRALYDRHAPWLMARLQHRSEDPGVVDEAVQDTFLAVWKQAATYDPARGSVGAWIWGIAIRRLIDQVRRRSSAATYGPPALHAVETADSAEDEALALDMGSVGEALDRLSPELQQVLRATVLDGLTTRETADLLDIPVGTVKTRLMRARHQLREAVS